MNRLFLPKSISGTMLCILLAGFLAAGMCVDIIDNSSAFAATQPQQQASGGFLSDVCGAADATDKAVSAGDKIRLATRVGNRLADSSNRAKLERMVGRILKKDTPLSKLVKNVTKYFGLISKALEIMNAWEKDGVAGGVSRALRIALAEGAKFVGGKAGTAAGVKGGAALGTLLGPVGTVVGGVVGGLLGNWAGESGAEALSNHIFDTYVDQRVQDFINGQVSEEDLAVLRMSGTAAHSQFMPRDFEQ